MTLSEKDGQLFYQLFLPLLDYVNKKCKVNRKLKNIAEAKSLDPQAVKEIANVLWENTTLIDSYLAENGKKLTDDHKQIIAGWKNCLQGRFAMERHLKKGTIFISMEDEKVYQVQGIISSWEEMFEGARMPLVMEATLIPFRDVIISDGLVMPYSIMIGSSMARLFKDIYMSAKKSGNIIRTLIGKEEKPMHDKKWKEFAKLQDKCMAVWVGAEKNHGCWQKAFNLLMELVTEEKKNSSNNMLTIEMLDDVTGYKYDVQGWLEDCLDEMEMYEEHELVLTMCEQLLAMFEWPDFTGLEIKFRKVTSLLSLSRIEEALKYSRAWIQKEPDNIMASVAGVYALIHANEYEEAEQLVKRFILDPDDCNEENDIMFYAAARLYEAMGKKREKKRIEKASKEYEERLSELLLDYNEMDDEFDFDDISEEDLPF